MPRPILLLLPLFAAALSVMASNPLADRLAIDRGRMEGYDRFAIESTLSAMPLDRIEGLWRMSADGGTFAIVRDQLTPTYYKLVVVDPVDRRLLPGTVMGMASEGAAKGVFDARIFSSVNKNGEFSRPKRFTLTLSDDNSRLVIQPVNNRLKINLLRLIPYMFRINVTKVNDRPRNLDGALRIFPEENAHLTGPVYL